MLCLLCRILLLLLIALFVVTIDGTINRWMILASAGLFGTIVLAIWD